MKAAGARQPQTDFTQCGKNRPSGQLTDARPHAGFGLIGRMSDFKKLAVWRKAHALALNSYHIAARIRGVDNASLRSQTVRAAMSIPTNIVEGAGQQSRKDFARFLSIALNSSAELEYHLIVLRDIRVLGENDFQSLSAQTVEVRKMLHGLRTRVLSTPRLSRSDVLTS